MSKAHERMEPWQRRLLPLTLFQAWGLTILGSAVCAPLAAGAISIVYIVFAIPVGLMVGIVLGAPVGLVLAWRFARAASPPRNPTRFAGRVEALGAAIALTITVPYNIVAVVTQAAPGPFGPSTPTGEVARLVAIGVGCIAASAWVGRLCGHVLARGHLKRCGLIPPAQLAPWFTIHPDLEV